MTTTHEFAAKILESQAAEYRGLAARERDLYGDPDNKSTEYEAMADRCEEGAAMLRLVDSTVVDEEPAT